MVTTRCHMFCMTETDILSEWYFTSYENKQNWFDEWIASKEEQFFYNSIHLLPEKWQNGIANDWHKLNKNHFIKMRWKDHRHIKMDC